MTKYKAKYIEVYAWQIKIDKNGQNFVSLNGTHFYVHFSTERPYILIENHMVYDTDWILLHNGNYRVLLDKDFKLAFEPL